MWRVMAALTVLGGGSFAAVSAADAMRGLMQSAGPKAQAEQLATTYTQAARAYVRYSTQTGHDATSLRQLNVSEDQFKPFGGAVILHADGLEGEAPLTKGCTPGYARRECAAWLVLPEVSDAVAAQLRYTIDGEWSETLSHDDMWGNLRVAHNPNGPNIVMMRLAMMREVRGL